MLNVQLTQYLLMIAITAQFYTLWRIKPLFLQWFSASLPQTIRNCVAVALRARYSTATSVIRDRSSGLPGNSSSPVCPGNRNRQGLMAVYSVEFAPWGCGGKSLLKIKYSIFHSPPECFKTTVYFPLSAMLRPGPASTLNL